MYHSLTRYHMKYVKKTRFSLLSINILKYFLLLYLLFQKIIESMIIVLLTVCINYTEFVLCKFLSQACSDSSLSIPMTFYTGIQIYNLFSLFTHIELLNERPSHIQICLTAVMRKQGFPLGLQDSTLSLLTIASVL